MLDQYLSVYITGLSYSIIGGIIISLCFAIYRWYKCINKYIKTGYIDDFDESWFLVENNWIQGSRDNYHFGNNPWVIGIDIFSVAIITSVLSLAWPVTIIASSVITYAKVARERFRRKKEFMDRLEGTHAGA